VTILTEKQLKEGKKLVKCMAICCAAVLMIDSAAAVIGQPAKPAPWRRWAIVATPELRGGGLSDLLTARLSEDDSIELVEREQLDLALRELDLAAHFGADDAGRRLELGKLLKADALVLLSVRRHEDQPFLRLVVCDCMYGARLSEEFRPMKEGQPAEAADWALSAIAATRNRFPAGITRLIAVPPFVSKDLTHERDHSNRTRRRTRIVAARTEPRVGPTGASTIRSHRRQNNFVGPHHLGWQSGDGCRSP
jgi:hypothetical protein